MEESKFLEEFSLIKKYNLLHRIGTQQESEYPICWAHALAEMITDSVRIYQIDQFDQMDQSDKIDVLKSNMSSSKRRKIDEITYENTSNLDYLYTTSLIWITSHYGFRRKKFDFLFDTQTYVSSEKCYPFEQTIFKLVNDNPSKPEDLGLEKESELLDSNYYREKVSELLVPPYFQPMNLMKDKDGISYKDRCKYDKYDDKLYEPLNKDNELYVNFIFKPYVDKMYSVLFENNLSKVGLFNSPEINIDWEKHQKNMKKILSCNKIIKAGITLNDKIYTMLRELLREQYDDVKYFNFDDFVNQFKIDEGDDDYDEYFKHDKKNKYNMVFHKILIYGWVNNGDREYWIIRDSFVPEEEYYFPLAKKDDKFFLGLELKYGIIDIKLSEYLKEKIDKNVENLEKSNSIFER
jgi:hypothetical protein